MDKATMQACFAEWMRRYQADPGAFAAEWPRSEPNDYGADDYGADAAAYMQRLAAELKQPLDAWLTSNEVNR